MLSGSGSLLLRDLGASQHPITINSCVYEQTPFSVLRAPEGKNESTLPHRPSGRMALWKHYMSYAWTAIHTFKNIKP